MSELIDQIMALAVKITAEEAKDVKAKTKSKRRGPLGKSRGAERDPEKENEKKRPRIISLALLGLDPPPISFKSQVSWSTILYSLHCFLLKYYTFRYTNPNNFRYSKFNILLNLLDHIASHHITHYRIFLTGGTSEFFSHQ